jgi:hypothetical protein
MNSTNRFLNRLFVFVVGLALLAAGASVSVGALLPDLQETIGRAAESAVAPATDAITAQPWVLWAAAAVAVVLIVVLLWFVLRQGGGRTGTLLRVDEGPSRNARTGSVTVDVKVAAHVLEEAVSRNPDVVSVDVAAFRVKRENALRLTAHARRGASPVELRRAIDSVVAEWDGVLGAETPIVIRIVSGIRTSLAGTNRVA